MKAKVVPLSSRRRKDALGALGTNPTPAIFLQAITEFSHENWGLTELRNLVGSVAWDSDPKAIEGFARFLGSYWIDFENPENQSASVRFEENSASEPTALEKKAGASIVNAINRMKAAQEMMAFTRALPIASLLHDALGDKSPLKVVEDFLQQAFRPEPSAQTGAPLRLREADPLMALLREIDLTLAKANPNDPHATVTAYFLSSPYQRTPRITVSEMRTLCKLGYPYGRLMFRRHTTKLYERMDPMPESWPDLDWLFECASSPWDLTRVVEACFEICDHAGDMAPAADGSVERKLNAFFSKVRLNQNLVDGRSFWDEDTAVNKVGWLFGSWLANIKDVRMDLNSHLCWIGQEEFEPAEPGFDQWEILIREAFEQGYVVLAQSLTAYKLIEDVLLIRRLSDWPAFIRLNRMLRQEPHYPILTEAIRVSAAVLEKHGNVRMSRRLGEQAVTDARPKEAQVLHLIEGASRREKPEVELRLVEHIGKITWERLADQSRYWLIEADMAWSDFNFRKGDEYVRTDWSHPVTLFAKAIENELALRYAECCRESGDCSKGRDRTVSFGQIVYFLRQAAKGEPQRTNILRRFSLSSAPDAVLMKLERFRDEYRNPSAHPRPFSQALLSSLRWELFGESVLRVILEFLHSVESPRGA